MTKQTRRRVTRLLPGLTTEYTIVSMPEWAWPWLDTLVAEHFPRGYRDFLRECTATGEDLDLEAVLEIYARARRENHYRLTNDNWPEQDTETVARRLPRRRVKALRFAKAMKLFSFLPHATTWEQVLTRRGWHLEDPTSY